MPNRTKDYLLQATSKHPAPLRSSWRSMQGASLWSIITLPIIYFGIVPVVLLDLFTTVYQGVCFKDLGQKKVVRKDFIRLDRHNLPYLNFIERINCDYCAYFNGVLAYAREVGGRTELHFCPIRNATLRHNPHAQYKAFTANGDAAAYEAIAEAQLRRHGKSV